MRLYGLIATSSLKYQLVAMAQVKGSWRIAKTLRWNCDNRLRTLLLGSHAVTAGVTTHWRTVPDQLTAGVPTWDKDDVKSLEQNLGRNLQSIVSADIFLATIPCFFSSGVPETFIAVCPMGDYFKIGLIRNSKLVAVFNLASGAGERLHGHLNRIIRFLELHHNLAPKLPIYYLGTNPPVAGDLPLIPVVVPGGENSAVMQAGGVALAPAVNAKNLPVVIASVHPLARFIGHRRRLLLVAAALTAMALVAIAAGELYRFVNTASRSALVAAAPDILSKQNDSLASLILLKRNQFAVATNWTALLETLGDKRPEGLYYERLGCEPLAGNPELLRVAITGHAQEELTITTLLRALQECRFITQSTIAKLERSTTNPSSILFQIVCTFQLSAQ